MTENRTKSSNTVSRNVPPHLDLEDIPNHWKVSDNPFNINKNACILAFYARPEKDPSCTISLLAPNTERVAHQNEKWTVEVQDKDSDESNMGTLNPVELVEDFDELEDASNRLVELANEYPIDDTIEYETKEISGVRKKVTDREGNIDIPPEYKNKTLEVTILGKGPTTYMELITKLFTPPITKKVQVTQDGTLTMGEEFGNQLLLFSFAENEPEEE